MKPGEVKPMMQLAAWIQSPSARAGRQRMRQLKIGTALGGIPNEVCQNRDRLLGPSCGWSLFPTAAAMQERCSTTSQQRISLLASISTHNLINLPHRFLKASQYFIGVRKKGCSTGFALFNSDANPTEKKFLTSAASKGHI
jgi:hypothetical protein